MKKFILLANGKPPGKGIITFLRARGYNTLICADGGANSARKLKIVPDYIIGDLDSITNDNLKYFKQKSVILKFNRQNDTDVEKCLKFAIKKKYTDAIFTGVTGDRLDHTFCNLGIVIKFFNKIRIRIIAENSLLTPYAGNVEINTLPGETFSLYGFDDDTKIVSSGLKYPLKNISIPFGEKESTSNVAISGKVNLKISKGIIFVIRDFKTVKDNLLF